MPLTTTGFDTLVKNTKSMHAFMVQAERRLAMEQKFASEP